MEISLQDLSIADLYAIEADYRRIENECYDTIKAFKGNDDIVIKYHELADKWRRKSVIIRNEITQRLTNITELK